MEGFEEWFEDHIYRLKNGYREEHGRNANKEQLYEYAEAEYLWLKTEEWDNSDHDPEK